MRTTIFFFLLRNMKNVNSIWLENKNALSVTIHCHGNNHDDSYKLNLSALQKNTGTFVNNIDPDELAHNEPSHLDLHCLPFCFDTPI